MMEGFGSPPSTPAEASLSRSGLDPSSLDPESILSPDEVQLLHRRFAAFNPNANKTRSLAAAHAIRLFRDDFSTLSEWEIQELFTRCDLNNDGQLAQHEYVHARAYHRVLVEAAREDDVVRSFTILDTDSDGVIHAKEVLHLVEQARQPSARLLKQAILQSAVATKQSSHPYHRASTNHEEDDITCDHFVTTIRDVNRGIEREIAAKTVRMLSLEDKLHHHQETLQGVASGFDRAALVAKIESVQIEIDVLKKEIARAKREFVVTDSNSALTKICETLVATYENEQHVYECLTNFITYCGLRDPVLFRQRLEAAGRQVNVLDSILMAPTHHVQTTTEYTLLTDLTLRYHNCRDVHTPSAHRIHERQTSGFALDASRHARLLTNSTLRRHFAYYTMAGSITNLATMTRSNFAKFVKDCTLHTLVSPPLTDPDIDSIYATATRGTNPQEQHHRRERAHMTFVQWLVACELLLQRLEPNVPLNPDTLEALIKVHVIARAKVITTQNLAPDVSQIHVLKLLREFLWLFKQIFAHFAGHSLIEVDTSIALSMSRFLRFARAFGES
ncbi:hypothetical protein Poli38472_006019 [Pythium oligandrum]|uniref:EF-hand domain-containing protein n=1 Tax=Pythium oligandrum TaxID=41045 RepID=A0A8K1FMS0_PYTOL|nr:hypothetical protein Poli38472_006019 [Pythium oligandrum]|eukprot:TMW68551.1 hypothetical protein Poli38472_006019 [Pythium oligandrum]